MKKHYGIAVGTLALGLSLNASSDDLALSASAELFSGLDSSEVGSINHLSPDAMRDTQGRLLGLLLTIGGIAAADGSIIQGMMSDYNQALTEEDKSSSDELSGSDVYARPDSNGVIYQNGREMEQEFYRRVSQPAGSLSTCDTFCADLYGF